MGGDDWSVAVGDDWVRRRSGIETELRLEREGVEAWVFVSRELRPRGTAADALTVAMSDFREDVERNGGIFLRGRAMQLDDAAAQALSFGELHCGVPVQTLVRTEATAARFGLAACTAPAAGGDVEARCRPLVESLVVGTPRTAPAGQRLVGPHVASALVPEAWVDIPIDSATLREARSDASAVATKLIVEASDNPQAAAAIVDDVTRYYTNRGGVLVRSRTTRIPGGRRVESLYAYTMPAGLEGTTVFAVRGRHLYTLTCREQTSEIAASRARCPAIIASFRFDAP